jgi:hypothetical protein
MFNFIESPKRITAPSQTLGIEATRPDTIQRCGLGNIDEQHRQGGDGRAAIEVALTYPLPADGTHLVTDRPDLDSIGAMAVLSIRLLGVELSLPALERIAMVAAADSFHAPAEWAPSPLPTVEQPWPSGPAAMSEVREFGAIVAFLLAASSATAVAMVAGWLLFGEPETEPTPEIVAAWQVVDLIDPGIMRNDPRGPYPFWVFPSARAEAESMRYRIAVTARDALTVRDGVAYVTSDLPALGLGYRVAPVVVLTNPWFCGPRAGGPVKKVTIAFYRSPGEEQLQSLVDALNAAEGLAPGEGGGWGGNLRSGIIGSPQGRAPRATPEQIEAAVRAVVGGAS